MLGVIASAGNNFGAGALTLVFPLITLFVVIGVAWVFRSRAR